MDLVVALEALSEPGRSPSLAAGTTVGSPVQPRARRTTAWSISLVVIISLAAVIYFAIERWNAHTLGDAIRRIK
jgi:hypothetical protein